MGQKTTFLAIGLIVFTVILVVLFAVTRIIGGSPREKKQETTTETTTEISQNIVPVNDIIANPTVYDGYNVEITSRISDWTTNKSFYFAAQNSGLMGSKTRGILLAVASQPFQLPQASNDDSLGLGELSNVTATGKVEILNKEQLQGLLGENLEDPSVTLRNDVIANWKLGPVLIMDTIKVIPDEK